MYERETDEKKQCNFCKECGSKLKKEAHSGSSCPGVEHDRHRSIGYKYCPDCGKKL